MSAAPRLPARLFRRSSALLWATALVGCGGGGGGGDGAGSGGAAPPPVSEPRAVLSESGALQASGIVLNGFGYLGYAAEMASVAADTATSLGTHTGRCISAAGDEVPMPIALVDNDNNQTVSANDAVTIEFENCGGESRRARFALRSVDRAGERVEGTVTFRAETAAGVVTEGEFDFVSTYLVPRSRYRQTLSNIRATAITGANTATFSGATFERAFDAMVRYTFRMSGTVSSPSLGGAFTFATPQPFGGVSQFFPESGELLVTAGAARARFVARVEPVSVPEFFDYQVDATGSGYSPPKRKHWLAVMSGLVFGVTPSARPEITRFELTPANPHAGDELRVVYDVDLPPGDLLTKSFVWRRNGVDLPSVFGPSAAPRQFRRGDVIEVELRVSNGRWSDFAAATATLGNEPPALTLTLSPPGARSIDDLTLSATATDGDGDAVELRYEWRRNGVLIAGQGGNVLPATEHARADVITGTAIASDGAASTTHSADVTIADSPPRVTVVSPPSSARYGDAVSFAAQAEDPDGDATGGFEVLYGPAGMTVDASTGIVRFIADPPMFDRSASFEWAITTSYPGAFPAAGIVEIEDSARSPVVMRTGLQLSQQGGLEVADFDADGDAEVLVLAPLGLYELSASGGGYRQSWAYPFAVGSWLRNRVFATADVDGDARREIFLAQGEVIAKLDGTQRRLAARAAPFADDIDGCEDLEVGDVDADGAAEVVCLGTVSLPEPPYHSSTLIVLDADTLAVEWEADFADYGKFVELANVDLDPALEIVTNLGYVLDGAARAVEWHNPGGFGRSGLVAGDLDGDGVAEIVAAHDAGFDVGDPGTIRAFDARARGVAWSIPNAQTGSLALADVGGDARLELLVGDGDDSSTGLGKVTAFAMTGPGTTALVFEIPGRALSGVVAIGAGDVDADGARELVWSASPLALTIVGLGPSFAVEWRSAYDRTLLRGPYAGGMLARNGPSTRLPLFMSWTSWEGAAAGARVFALDPDTTDVVIGSHDFGQFAYPGLAIDAADFDGDGVDEAFVGLAPAAGATHTAYDFFAERAEWVSQPLPNEYGPVTIKHADVNGDGSDDLVSIGAGGVNIYDVVNGVLLDRISTVEGVDVEVVAENGGMLVVGERAALRVYRHTAQGFAASGAAVPIGELRDVTVGDVDGDGRVDIFAIAGFSGRTTLYRFDDRLEPVVAWQFPWHTSGITIEPTPFAHKNLALSRGERLGQLVIIDPRTGHEVWHSPPLNGGIARESVHFFEVEGRRHVSLATELGVYLTR